MKKTLLYVLMVCVSMVFVAGCGETKKDGGPSVSLSNPDSLVGTYNVDVFWVNAVVAQLTNNCDEAKKFIDTTEAAVGGGCTPAGNVTATAKATIEKDVNGNYVFKSKMQMAGGIISDTTMIPFQTILQPEQYNYTLYSPIPSSEITSPIANIGASQATGTTGRNAINITADDNATYTFEARPDGRLLNKMTKSVPLAVNVYVLLKKTSDSVEALEENVRFSSPEIPKWNDTAVPPTPIVVP